MFAGILGGAGLAFSGARPGGVGGVGSIGGELHLGDGWFAAWHAFVPPYRDIAGGRERVSPSKWSSDRKGRGCFVE